MWSRKQSVCSAVSVASKCDDQDTPFTEQQIYPFAIALRVRVLQIVCGIGGVVVGAVGWLEEREKPVLGLGVPAGAVTVLAAVTSVYFSRGFGGWVSARSRTTKSLGAPWRALGPSPCAAIPLTILWTIAVTAHIAMLVFSIRSLMKLGGFGGWVSARSRTTKSWGAPWRALGPSPCAAIPLTILWTIAITAHITMLVFSIRSLMKLGCSSRTCVGVAAAQLSVSISTLAAALFMLQMDLRYDPALSPPRQSDTNTCTGVSMVPLTSVAINSGNSGEEGSPLSKKREQPPDPPT